MRFSSGTIASVAWIYIDNEDQAGSDVSAWLDTFDDSSSSTKGILEILPASPSSSSPLIFSVTGSVINGTGYRKIPVSYISGSLPSNLAELVLSFSRAGDAGSGGGGGATIRPSQITAWQNNYSPTTWSTAERILISFDTSFPFITGLDATGATDSTIKRLINTGSNVGGLKANSSSSSSGNRIAAEEDLILLPGEGVDLYYDATAAVWRPSNPALKLSERRSGRYCGYYRNDFLQRVADNVLSFWSSGSGASHALNQFNGRFGVIDHNTGSTSTGTAYLYGGDGSNPNWMMKGGAGMWFEWCVRIEDLSTSGERFGLNIGFIDSYNYNGHADAVMFRYRDDVNGGKWQLVSYQAAAEEVADSGVSVAADTWYVLRAFIHSSSKVDYYINGSYVGSTTTYIPINRDFGFGLILTKAVGTSNRIVYSDYAIMGQISNALG